MLARGDTLVGGAAGMFERPWRGTLRAAWCRSDGTNTRLGFSAGSEGLFTNSAGNDVFSAHDGDFRGSKGAFVDSRAVLCPACGSDVRLIRNASGADPIARCGNCSWDSSVSGIHTPAELLSREGSSCPAVQRWYRHLLEVAQKSSEAASETACPPSAHRADFANSDVDSSGEIHRRKLIGQAEASGRPRDPSQDMNFVGKVSLSSIARHSDRRGGQCWEQRRLPPTRRRHPDTLELVAPDGSSQHLSPSSTPRQARGVSLCPLPSVDGTYVREGEKLVLQMRIANSATWDVSFSIEVSTTQAQDVLENGGGITLCTGASVIHERYISIPWENVSGGSHVELGYAMRACHDGGNGNAAETGPRTCPAIMCKLLLLLIPDPFPLL